MLTVSQSAINRYRRCEQQYYYNDILKIRRRERRFELEFGTYFHTYVEAFYRALKEQATASEAHKRALTFMHLADKTIKSYVGTALAAGSEDVAKNLSEIPDKAERIAQRYYTIRGENDADEYEILFVEERLEVPVDDEITSVGKVDLVTRHRKDKIISLWDHKTSAYPPDLTRGLRDLQTLLYAQKIKLLHNLHVDEIVWNCIRTKEPTVPEILKSGKVTKRADLDTTWATYEAVLQIAGINLEEYAEIRSRLEDRETTVFFVRQSHPIIAQPDILLRDYVATAKEIEEKKIAWNSQNNPPIRSVDYTCSRCDYEKLCIATITGGDEEDVIRLAYTSPSLANEIYKRGESTDRSTEESVTLEFL